MGCLISSADVESEIKNKERRDEQIQCITGILIRNGLYRHDESRPGRVRHILRSNNCSAIIDIEAHFGFNFQECLTDIEGVTKYLKCYYIKVTWDVWSYTISVNHKFTFEIPLKEGGTVGPPSSNLIYKPEDTFNGDQPRRKKIRRSSTHATFPTLKDFT